MRRSGSRATAGGPADGSARDRTTLGRPQTRAELFDIVRATGITTVTELVQRHGTGRGCDICKPVGASILASQAKVRDFELYTKITGGQRGPTMTGD